MESDSGRLLIWREQRTRYHQSNTVERHSYRGGGILVWAGISLGGHTDLHVFHCGTVTGLRYRDETLNPYVRPYAAAIGNDFILMDDNARPHRARIVEEYLEDHGLERMEWPARSPDLNPIEHLWDYLGREVAALNPPPRSLHELKQGLLFVWSSLPIPVSDNLINSMGNRCRQCIQGRQGKCRRRRPLRMTAHTAESIEKVSAVVRKNRLQTTTGRKEKQLFCHTFLTPLDFAPCAFRIFLELARRFHDRSSIPIC
ncbi:transposable element Tc3 transposase [Trichonephila clavipes]|nr:transposable element Tc3 transposase [Trichonephila clavipes]